MSDFSIPPSLRRRVLADARTQCAYCHSLTSITGAKPVIDHIVPRAAGGATQFDNLCLACHACNEFKGAQVEGRRTKDGGRRTEDGGRRTEDGRRKTEDGRRKTENNEDGSALSQELGENRPADATSLRGVTAAVL